MFRIRHAAKLAGISPTLLRAWERRYRLVAPARTPSGYRVYSEGDVELLRAAARLVAGGHSISEVARLARHEILAGAEASAFGNAPPVAAGNVDAIAPAIAGALAAIAAFDQDALETALFPVTTLAGLGPVAVCEQVLLPLLRAIGDRWAQGDLSIAAEHFGSGICRAKILQCFEFVARGAGERRVVCACPENEFHEGGLLVFAVHAAAAHWQVIYLGAHTPIVQALETAARLDADLLALSLTQDRPAAEIEALAHALAAKEPRRRARVIVGGRAALLHRKVLEAAGAEVQEDIRIPAVDPPPANAALPTR